MALADYRLCDKCGEKTFYDADLNYEFEPPQWDTAKPSIKYMGTEQNKIWLGRLGDWAVICSECAKTHKCIIVPIKE